MRASWFSDTCSLCLSPGSALFPSQFQITVMPNEDLWIWFSFTAFSHGFWNLNLKAGS